MARGEVEEVLSPSQILLSRTKAWGLHRMRLPAQWSAAFPLAELRSGGGGGGKSQESGEVAVASGANRLFNDPKCKEVGGA